MLQANSPEKISLPFSSSGSKNAIPENSQRGGVASYEDGFPSITMIPLNIGGIPPDGKDMNGILYELSSIARWANVGGGYVYDQTFAENASVLGYPKGARVLSSDGYNCWVNTVDGNMNNPETTPEGWVTDFSAYAQSITMTSSNVTLTPLQYGKKIIVITGLLTSSLNLVFPTVTADWIVINNTTGSYTITAKTASGVGVLVLQSYLSHIFSDGTNIKSMLDSLRDSTGSSFTGFIQSGSGSVATTVQTKLRENISVKDFGAVGDGVVDDTTAIQNAVNASAGKQLIAVFGETYLVQDQITVPSNVHIDFNGASITDDIRTYRGSDQADRAKPLFYMYGVNNVKIKNFSYTAVSATRSSKQDVPTGIIWIGDNATSGYSETYDIEISGIHASSCISGTMFFGILGESYNIHVHDIVLSGNVNYGINIEYGLAPSGSASPANYGLHPHNISVNNFYGLDNEESVGFFRVAGCYNVKFSNCYGKDVKSFIYVYTGDRSITRVSESVVFENCTHYSSDTFLSGTVNYCVQILCPNKDGSTGDPLLAYTNYEHLIYFSNCQFQSNHVVSSACVRFYGMQGSTSFKNCVFQNSYYGVRAEPSSNPNYTSLHSLRFDNCVFKNHYQALLLTSIRGVLVEHCNFLTPQGGIEYVVLSNGAIYNTFNKCKFSGMEGGYSYIKIPTNCNYNSIEECVFADGLTVPPIESKSITNGKKNACPSSKYLTVTGIDYYGLLNEPSTMYEQMSLSANPCVLNSRRRRFYVIDTSSAGRTIEAVFQGAPGDEVIVLSVSSLATTTFKHNMTTTSGGVTIANSERIFCSSGADLVKTSPPWVMRLLATPQGWLAV